MNVASKQSIKGKLMFDEPMSKHTSWRLGGPADRYYVPADLRDLQNYLAELRLTSIFCGWALAVTCWCATADSAAR